MKKILFTLLMAVSFVLSAAGQAKKPTIMVVPSDAWCNRNGYVTEFDNMGTIVKVPDYSAAFVNDSDIRIMISALADFMASNGYPIQSLEQELNRLKNEDAEMAMMTGKNEGGEIAETPVERLRRTAKADILLNLDYTLKKLGPSKQIEFNLQAIDAYTSKIISGNTGTSEVVSTSTPNTAILQESVLNFRDNLFSSLTNHFDDLFNNGREITVTLLRYDTCPIDFEEEVEANGYDVELADVIDAWFAENTVEGRYSLDAKSANRMRFTQARIPLYDVNPINGREQAIDANGFARNLVRLLRKNYGLTVGSSPKGLGEVWITIGDK